MIRTQQTGIINLFGKYSIKQGNYFKNIEILEEKMYNILGFATYVCTMIF